MKMRCGALLMMVVLAGCSSNNSTASGSSGTGGIDGSAGSAGASGSAGLAGSAGSGGSAGGSGSGGAAGAPTYTPSAELTALLAAVAELEAGQPADLDGDGTADATLTKNADGSSSYSDDHDGDGTPEFVYQSDGKGNATISVDANQDGIPEQVIVFTVTSTTHKEVLTADTNLNGVMDHRYTWVSQAATLSDQTYTEEADANETGTFSVVQTLTLSTSKNAGSTCDGNDGFPSSGTGYQPFKDSPTIEGGSGAGDCSAADSSSIAAAVDCALTKGALCLANTNTREYNSLMAAAFGGAMTPLSIGCGNACSGVIASTQGFSWFFDSRMNINPAEWHKLGADDQCNIMLHEMMHWAGDQGSADHNDPNGAGHDAVYSCGRYCGRCSHAGHGSPNNSSVDCAYCADTLDRKQQCGEKTKFQQVACGVFGGGLCHAGLGCIAADCQACGGVLTQACDDTTLDEAPSCCQTCPTACSSSNDIPCGSGPAPTDTCTDATPPFCK